MARVVAIVAAALFGTVVLARSRDELLSRNASLRPVATIDSTERSFVVNSTAAPTLAPFVATTASPVADRWRFANGGWRYSSGGVDVVPRSANETRECLRGRRVAFVGDSRTRYQYLTLARFVATGRRAKCAEPDDPTEFACVFANERRSKGWRDFYETTTNGLTVAGSRETCACYRPEDAEGLDWPTASSRIVERRVFEGRGATLFYFQNFGSLPMLEPLGSATGPGRPIGTRPFDLETYAKLRLPLYRPTHVFLNGGWGDADVGAIVARYAEDHPGVVVVAANNPAFRDERSGSDVARARGHDRKRIAWTAPPALYWDNAHVSTSVNDVFVETALEFVCPRP